MKGPLACLADRFPTLLMARRNLARTKVRTTLAALGIVIGVIAIASLGMFGVSLRHQITDNLGDIGNQVRVVPATQETGDTEISRRNAKRIDQIVTSGTVIPAKTDIRPVNFNGRGDPGLQRVVGMKHPAETYTAAEGRIPDPLRSGAIVGAEVAEEHDLSPGSTITVNGTAVRVRAVLEHQSGFTTGNPNNKVILPTDGFEQTGFSYVLISTESGPAANETAIAIRESLNNRRKQVLVRDFSGVVENIRSTFRILNGFLIGIGSISLLVAGVSILNVMLMSTVERREEIGVLRAVGFQKRDVLKVMLTEAMLLGVFGGVIGIACSAVAGMAINHFVANDVMATFRLENLMYVLLAFGFGVGTSVISGLYPAWKAANERPVEALRS